MTIQTPRIVVWGILLPALLAGLSAAAQEPAAARLKSSDLYRMHAVDEVALSPDGQRVAYTVTVSDRPGRPYAQIWIMDLASRKTIRVGGETEATSSPLWSPNGKWLARAGGAGDKAGLWITRADGSADSPSSTFLAPMVGSNSPIPYQGKTMSWSPDGTRIAFISSTPGPEAPDAGGDPVVITRYLYKPTYTEGLSHFNDNRRLHVFLVDLAARHVHQLTDGVHDEHSIDWAPNGEEILFVSNHEPNSDEFFNYDIFTVKVADGTVRRLTATEGCEYSPRWSPDGRRIVYAGTRRGLTDRETTMEDDHIWLMNADGSNPHEIGAAIDKPQTVPQWSLDGKSVYFTVQDRGSFHLLRLPVSNDGSPGHAETVVGDRGAIGGWSIGKDGTCAFAFATPTDMAQLFLTTGESAPRKLTDLNAKVLAGKKIAEVEPFTFISNDNKFSVEAFLTKPKDVPQGLPDMAAAPKHPLIVNIHGGPHWANGPAFNFKYQVYAARGWATLQVNYRGSTGYGQQFADACFGDLDGNEGQDVLYGVNAALRRFLWLDRERMGIEGFSYGGQLSDWLITQTNEFKAAIPMDGISNLISQNYMGFYNQYEEMEFGRFLHQGNLMDLLWERSPLKHVANVHTPTMLMHGENDADVPIAEDEQFYIALKDVGVETVMVRYPREGHGMREIKHVVDSIDRSIDWYEKHFPHAGAENVTNTQP